MRKVFVILAVLMAVSITAQTHEILKHNGEKVLINYIKTVTTLIYFSNPNSSEEGKISTYAVQSLTEKSTGKIQDVSSKSTLNFFESTAFNALNSPNLSSTHTEKLIAEF